MKWIVVGSQWNLSFDTAAESHTIDINIIFHITGSVWLIHALALRSSQRNQAIKPNHWRHLDPKHNPANPNHTHVPYRSLTSASFNDPLSNPSPTNPREQSSTRATDDGSNTKRWFQVGTWKILVWMTHVNL
eukprot:761375_1